MPLGDDVDGAVDHLDGGLVVYRVRRTRQAARPALRWPSCSTVLVIHVREDREVDDPKRFVAAGWRLPADEIVPDPGVITMLPALSPTQTVSSSDGSRSASPDCRIQWHRYKASPPEASRTSVS